MEAPEASRAARRAMVLTALVNRGFLEGESGVDAGEAKVYRDSILGWMDALDLWKEAEAAEERLLKLPSGAWSPKDQNLAIWRCEGVAALTWALRLNELPAYDAETNPQELADLLCFRLPEAKEVIEAAQLRSFRELQAQESLLLTLQWRLRDYGLRQEAKDFAKVAGQPVLRNLGLKLDGLLLDGGDLCLRGKPISALTYPEWISCMGIAQERRVAVLWLLGEGRLYSEIDTPT